jgi:hypothetical protein
MTLSPWSIGVFTSIDAGLGVHLDVAKELGIPSIQLHTPHAAGRTPAAAEAFLKKLDAYGIELTCVFGGFDGESYADIPTVERTIGLVIEFHGLTQSDIIPQFPQLVQKLQEYFDIVHLHANNTGPVDNNNLPEYLEITFLRRDLNDSSTVRRDCYLPGVDFPCNPQLEEYLIRFQ